DRSVLVTEAGSVDVNRASRGLFPTDVAALYTNWNEFRAWARRADFAVAAQPYDESALGNPAPAPRQIFAIGLNYPDHAKDSRLDIPNVPSVLTKFASSQNVPSGDILLTPRHVYREVALDVVIMR